MNMRISIQELEHDQEEGKLHFNRLEEQVEQISDRLNKLLLSSTNQVTQLIPKKKRSG
jgi:hypothetical protein